MKYPNLVDGASTNISVIAPASKATARGTVRGGRTTNDTATARPASASSATTIECPVWLGGVGVGSLAEPTAVESLAYAKSLLLDRVGTVSEEGGALTIAFERGTALTIPPHDAYEAWQIEADNGLHIVCVPGGELVTWIPEADPESTP